MRTLLASSWSAPLLLDPAASLQRAQPASALQQRVGWPAKPVSPRQPTLPPLPQAPSTSALGASHLPTKALLPPTGTGPGASANAKAPPAASEEGVAPPAPLQRTCSDRHGWRASASPLQEGEGDEALDDAEEARLFRFCFWPLFVWRRETIKSRAIEHRVTMRLFDGISRQRAYRRWRADALGSRSIRHASRAVHARVRRTILLRMFSRVLALAAHRRKCKEALASDTCVRLLASRFCTAPFLALRGYALCRSLVRRRSCGELMCRREALVHPMPLPPEWRAEGHLLCQTVSRAIVKDVQYRKISRHLRVRLAPVLLALLRTNVDLQRRKRYCVLRGFKIIYARVLARWSMYVLLGMGQEEEARAAEEEGTPHAALPGAFGARQRIGRTHGAYLRQRHAFDLLPDDEARSAPRAPQPSPSPLTTAAPGEARRTVVDIRVGAKLQLRRQRLEQVALRIKNGEGVGECEGARGPHHLDIQMLAGSERTAEYTRRLAERQAEVAGEYAAVEARGARLRRRADQRSQWRAHQEKELTAVEEQVAEALEEDAGRTHALLASATSSLEHHLGHKVDQLLRAYNKVLAEVGREYTAELARRCLNALKGPLRERRATALRNKWKLRRWLRVCARLNAFDRSMHRYRRLRLLHRCLWGWLYATADSLARMEPGLSAHLQRRAHRVRLYSRLLEAGRSDRCPRCLFARWLEWTNLRVTRRSIVRCSLARIDASLLGRVFHAWTSALALKRAGADGCASDAPDALLQAAPPPPSALEMRFASELHRWSNKVMRPETYAGWLRRKNRWARKRSRRLAKEAPMRVGLIQIQGSIRERIQLEADLHFDEQKKEAGAIPPSAYLTGALELREQEVLALWRACAAMAKALHHTEPSETPKWAEALRPARVALGLARWMFNALARGLPTVGQPVQGKGGLPSPQEMPRYWTHFDVLLARSKERTTQASRV
jgi:hypothetical protein